MSFTPEPRFRGRLERKPRDLKELCWVVAKVVLGLPGRIKQHDNQNPLGLCFPGSLGSLSFLFSSHFLPVVPRSWKQAAGQTHRTEVSELSLSQPPRPWVCRHPHPPAHLHTTALLPINCQLGKGVFSSSELSVLTAGQVGSTGSWEPAFQLVALCRILRKFFSL